MHTERLLNVLVLGGAALIAGCGGGADTGDGTTGDPGGADEASAASGSGSTESTGSGGGGGASGSGGVGSGGEASTTTTTTTSTGSATSSSSGGGDTLTCLSDAPTCPLPCCWVTLGTECEVADACCGVSE